MPNPVLQTILNNRLTQAIGPVRNMLSTIRMAQNPLLGLRQMAQTDPLARQAVQIIDQNGGNEKTAFMEQAKAFGIDPNAVIPMINKYI